MSALDGRTARAASRAEASALQAPGPHWLDLDDPSARDPSVSGSKAACLAIAGGTGIRVLPGLVLTTAAHRWFLDAGQVLPADLSESVHTAWARLSERGRLPLVVRSSSTVEDIGTSSMAGRFCTVLDVRGWAAFLAAVTRVFRSPSRPAAMRAYRQLVPHYPLAKGSDAPIYEAFTVGRVRFLLTDTRSARDPAGAPNDRFRSTLGQRQRGWLLAELAKADRFGLVIWVNPDPWVGRVRAGADNWGGFARERRIIADELVDQDVDNLLMISGDAHMLAFDNGTHTDYSTSRAGGFPLFHAAAIDRPASIKGGPYTGPVFPGGGQFGTVEIDDDGTRVAVALTGRDWRSRRLFTTSLDFPPGG